MAQMIFATSNQGKLKELKDFLGDRVDLSIPERMLEVEETGDTFTENAFLKAKAYFDEFSTPSLADDSGLCVDALPEQLGVRSARFAPQFSDYKDKCAELLRLMEGQQLRDANFRCVLCAYFGPEQYYFFEGVLQGEIAHAASGDQGFGYDPVFIPQELEGRETLAELAEWKSENSHRAKASRHFETFLRGLGRS